MMSDTYERMMLCKDHICIVYFQYPSRDKWQRCMLFKVAWLVVASVHPVLIGVASEWGEELKKWTRLQWICVSVANSLLLSFVLQHRAGGPSSCCKTAFGILFHCRTSLLPSCCRAAVELNICCIVGRLPCQRVTRYRAELPLHRRVTIAPSQPPLHWWVKIDLQVFRCAYGLLLCFRDAVALKGCGRTAGLPVHWRVAVRLQVCHCTEGWLSDCRSTIALKAAARLQVCHCT